MEGIIIEIMTTMATFSKAMTTMTAFSKAMTTRNTLS